MKVSSVLRMNEILYLGFSTVVAWSTESVQIVRNECENPTELT